ncbi:hypothetical protein ACFOZY_11760 [Chungangia koreensis]|uniref:Uncharacterized protein n=1 Tax=Chungangia koreensis TaxID=752657 RepID=A0ABV8X7G5_9LACT
MKDQRKSIIVNEIHFWKKNQMLPEHYCDFLLALYEQEEQSHKPQKTKKSILSKESSIAVLWQMVLVITTIVVLLFVFYSTNLWVPIILSLLMLFILIGATYYFTKKTIKAPVLYVLLALILLGLSMKIWLLYFNDQPIVLIVVMFIHCVLWIIAGRVLKQVYFVISGIAGVLITLYYLFF